MDLHVLWTRAQIVQGVVTKLATVGTALAFAIGAATWFGGDLGFGTSALIGALTAVAVTGCWFVVALFTNPIDHRYLRAYLAEAVEIERPEQSPLAHHETAGGTRHHFDVFDRTADAPVCAVYSAGQIVISRSATGGNVVLYSRLADGRTVVTDRQWTVPREDCILNVCDGGDLETLAADHRALLDTLSSGGIPVDPRPDPSLVVDHLSSEREAFRQLGSIWGCFLAVDGRQSSMDLTVEIDGAAVRALHGLQANVDDAPRRVLAIEPAITSTAQQGQMRLTAH